MTQDVLSWQVSANLRLFFLWEQKQKIPRSSGGKGKKRKGDFVMHYSSFTSHLLVIYLSFTNTFNRYLLISCIAHPFIEFPSLESILLFGHFCIHFCKVCLCAGVHLCIASHHSGNIQWMNFKMNEWKNWQMRAH